MSALAGLFARTRAEGRAALIGYLPAGFPDQATGIAAVQAMIEGGVDAVEVGLPYSDPVMDGPVIQAAAERSLSGGTTTADVFATVRAVAATGAPALVMTYWNPVERYGVRRFAADFAAAGGSGVITPDLLVDEAADWLAATTANGVDPVFVVAPSSTDARLRRVTASCGGFVYAASTMGVTGARAQVGVNAAELVSRARAAGDLPVCVGLGVSTGDQAAEVAGFADGVIVGSAFVRLLLDAADPAAGVAAVRGLAQELAAGVRRAASAVEA